MNKKIWKSKNMKTNSLLILEFLWYLFLKRSPLQWTRFIENRTDFYCRIFEDLLILIDRNV